MIRQNTKSKVLENNNEIIILNTLIPEINEKPINIYSALFQLDSAVKLVSLFEIDSSFFSFGGDHKDMSYEKTYQGIKHFLHDFAVEEYKGAVAQELKREEKELKALNKELQSILKQNESYHKNISQNKSDSVNAAARIQSYDTDKMRKQWEIDDKKRSISSLSGNKEMEDEVKKQVKSLEKERKKIEKEIQKLNKNIVEYRVGNSELERKIEENEKNKEELLITIEEQKEIIKKITEKLNNIR
jgi:chromosome segregation ATPase